MFVIGLSGGIGSGKSTVANLFAAHDIDIIDTDIIAHQVVAAGTEAFQQIVGHFGNDVIADDGELDRRLLRKKIFASNSARDWLEQLIHPLIKQTMQDQIANANSVYCILIIPLLYETHSETVCDRILIVDVPPSIQRQRTLDRDEISEAQYEAIIASQATREQRLSIADDVLDNSGDRDTLAEQVEQLHKNYLQLSLAHQN